MKTLTIGRDPQCDIRFNDERISRHHAILRIHTFGKIEIVDNSSNGTFVNKVRLSSGKPFPVSRKNVISFADIQDGRILDWKDVPDPFRKIKITIFSSIAIIVIVLAALLYFNSNKSSVEYESFGGGSGVEASIAGDSSIINGGSLSGGQLETNPNVGNKSSEPTHQEKDSSSSVSWFEKTKQDAQRAAQEEKKKKEDQAKQNKAKETKENSGKTTIL